MSEKITGIVAPIFLGTVEVLDEKVNFGKGTAWLMPNQQAAITRTCRVCGKAYAGPNGFRPCGCPL